MCILIKLLLIAKLWIIQLTPTIANTTINTTTTANTTTSSPLSNTTTLITIGNTTATPSNSTIRIVTCFCDNSIANFVCSANKTCSGPAESGLDLTVCTVEGSVPKTPGDQIVDKNYSCQTRPRQSSFKSSNETHLYHEISCQQGKIKVHCNRDFCNADEIHLCHNQQCQIIGEECDVKPWIPKHTSGGSELILNKLLIFLFLSFVI